MAQSVAAQKAFARPAGGRMKFLVGGLLILAAIVYLIVSSTQSSAQFFYTVDELRAQGAKAVGKNLRVSGAVLGDTIQYDPKTPELRFSVAQVTDDTAAIEKAGGLAAALKAAAADPNAARIPVLYVGPKPDLMKAEAQAIVTGKLGEDGVFRADELLLKCPTRYEDSLPAQASGN
ncbi:MAG: cytochrome c maturation protein CcmE [Chloroflexi bacterium]|nr:cytochrome c maturation protein CcmE [Chloroflexota bacterium]